jgi:hypothetical protein
MPPRSKDTAQLTPAPPVPPAQQTPPPATPAAPAQPDPPTPDVKPAQPDPPTPDVKQAAERRGDAMAKVKPTDRGMVDALLAERRGYVQRDMPDRVSLVDEQLELRGYDPKSAR